MQLALGLGAVFVGVDLVLAGYTKRSLSRLLFGNWDKPGSADTAGQASLPPSSRGANAATGGTYAPPRVYAPGSTVAIVPPGGRSAK